MKGFEELPLPATVKRRVRSLVEQESQRLADELSLQPATSPMCQIALLHPGSQEPPVVTFASVLTVADRDRLVRSGDRNWALWDPGSWSLPDILSSNPTRQTHDLAEQILDGLEHSAPDADYATLVLQAVARRATAKLRDSDTLVSDDLVCWAADHDAIDPAAAPVLTLAFSSATRRRAGCLRPKLIRVRSVTIGCRSTRKRTSVLSR